MKSIKFTIENIPAVLYGEKSDSVFLFIHGAGGYKEEGEHFASLVKNSQVLAFDLPEHGERKDKEDKLYPWIVIPELEKILNYTLAHWSNISLRATSIGAWFSLEAFQNINFSHVLFVSPVVDMNTLIESMMRDCNVTVEELARKQIIQNRFGGPDLNYQYYCFAASNPILKWKSKTNILYGTHDNLTPIDTIKNFATAFKCSLKIIPNGQHYMHTKEDIFIMDKWIEESLD